jgi:hypothetical protein
MHYGRNFAPAQVRPPMHPRSSTAVQIGSGTHTRAVRAPPGVPVCRRSLGVGDLRLAAGARSLARCSVWCSKAAESPPNLGRERFPGRTAAEATGSGGSGRRAFIAAAPFGASPATEQQEVHRARGGKLRLLTDRIDGQDAPTCNLCPWLQNTRRPSCVSVIARPPATSLAPVHCAHVVWSNVRGLICVV